MRFDATDRTTGCPKNFDGDLAAVLASYGCSSKYDL